MSHEKQRIEVVTCPQCTGEMRYGSVYSLNNGQAPEEWANTLIYGKEMKILIVDDTKLSRIMILKRIPDEIKESAIIYQGTNGKEAVELYKDHSPDILFLDLTMPVMDGFEALSIIMEYDPKAVVYVVTADVQAKSVEIVMAAGAKGLESKPISEDRLAEIFSHLKESLA